jgi:UDPglucose 6-dehydrogenase
MASAIGLAELGHRVVGFDIIRERVRGLQCGQTPYREHGLESALKRNLNCGGLRFTESLADAVLDAEFIIIAVGTPSKADGSADLSFLYAAIDSLREQNLAGKTLVIRSTVPCGTSEFIANKLAGIAEVVYAPEFLREGSALPDFLSPDRVVVGAQKPETAARFLAIFEPLGKPLVATTLGEAELIKGFSNAFLALKISFANEVANLCETFDANALSVLSGIGHDRRIGSQFLEPGIGYGGPCFDKDVRSMQHVAETQGASSELLAATIRVNHAQPLRVVELLEAELGKLDGVSIGVWGVTFKAGTDDVRDSLAVKVINEIVARGGRVRAFDPAVSGAHTAIHCDLADSALAVLDADALLVLTEWPAFRDVAPALIAQKLRRGVVVDGRNLLDGDALAAEGVRYRGIGQRSTPGELATRRPNGDASNVAV